MAGAIFVRVDLHVHSRPDEGPAIASPADYVRAALNQGLAAIAITDHNTAEHVRDFLAAAEGTQLAVFPGVELTTNDGHLLAIFAPDGVGTLEQLVRDAAIQTDFSGTRRTQRSMLDLVGTVGRLGGLAIPAHVDAGQGVAETLSPGELKQLLCHPHLAGLEFKNVANLDWFTDQDEDSARRSAWATRCADPALRQRGLARLMSSDAHSPGSVGRDTTKRLLTRLRVDECNFEAIRNAVLYSPRGRCRVEAFLPESYPRIVEVRFEGGFLDGVCLEPSPNLTCIIGGRGSGKSTALVALRAALGVSHRAGEDPDEIGRMPDRTVVRFLDVFGNERTAVRERGFEPVDEVTGDPIRLLVADLAQDETGGISRGYESDPRLLSAFLESFCDLRRYDEEEAELLEELQLTEGEVFRTRPDRARKGALGKENAELSRRLSAATTGNAEQVARYAAILAAEEPLLQTMTAQLSAIVRANPVKVPDLAALARTFSVDLENRPAVDFALELADALERLRREATEVSEEVSRRLDTAAVTAREVLSRWGEKHVQWQLRAEERKKALREAGLEVQVGELERIGRRLAIVRAELTRIGEREQEHAAALANRGRLVNKLHSNREQRRLRRQTTLRGLRDRVNQQSDGWQLHLRFEPRGMAFAWVEWLRANFAMRTPRVERAAAEHGPRDVLATFRTQGVAGLGQLKLADGRSALEADNVAGAADILGTFEAQFRLETMPIEDRPVLEVQEPGSAERRSFDHLSAGQQRSVLLSLALSSDRPAPLIVDQPEDHLDAAYVATGVVRQLERIKEARQVLIATHNANLTVLGDAELVVPMYADAGRGAPKDIGAVDHSATRARVCELLEGGEDAYKRRGERYGFQVV